MSDQLNNPAFVLFHSYWSWEVPAWALVSRYAREEYGLSLPEDKRKAAAIMSNMERVTAKASEMAPLVYRNTAVPVNIVDPHDAIKLYIVIMEHMAMWVREASSRSLVHRPIPIEGLREFNALANKLFPVAHRYGYYKEPEKNMSNTLQALLTGKPVERQEHRFNDQLIVALESLSRAQQRRYKII